MKITTKIIKPPTYKPITVICPGCGTIVEREVDLTQTEGKIICALCLCAFEWKEEK